MSRHILLLLLLCSFAGCASLPPGGERDPRDHIERFNRGMFKLNTALDRAVMRPAARGYVRVTPALVRSDIANFLVNLAYTTTIVNDALQGRLGDFGRDLVRLAVDTTLGIGGFLDPATRLGLARHDRDFGQTLGQWGVATGSYLVLPLLGPSDMRDALGTVADRFTSADGHITGTGPRISLFAARALDTRAGALPADSTLDSAYDPYALVRSAWFQQRVYKVHGSDLNYPPPLPQPEGGTHP